MATFLLYWNPFFSSYKMDRFLSDFGFSEGRDVLNGGDDWDRSPNFFNWDVLEHEKARRGDRFVFVKVGYEKPTGIVGVGSFTSDPYVSEDWSGQGRQIYYMDMRWESLVRPDSDKLLKTEDLLAAIPEVAWAKGHSGTEVSPDAAAKIDALWQKHLKGIK